MEINAAPSEVQPHIELNQARAITVFPGNNVGGPSDLAEAAAIAAAGLARRDAVAIAVRIREGRSVGDVQGLGPQLEVEAFRQLECPQERRVHVEIVRPVKLIEGLGAKALRINRREAIRLKPLLARADLVRDSGRTSSIRPLVATRAQGTVGSAPLDRTIRNRGEQAAQLPAAQNFRAYSGLRPSLAGAERQLVNKRHTQV